MDIFNAIKKAVNVAETVIKTAERLSDRSASPETREVPESKPAPEPKKTLAPTKDELFASAVLPGGEMQRITDNYGRSEISYETSVDFYEFDSGAEPFACYMYSPEGIDEEHFDINKPALYLIDCDRAINKAVKTFLEDGAPEGVDSWEPIEHTHLLFRARFNNHFGRAVYFYGLLFEDRPCGFVLEYGKNLEGTAEEKTIAAYFKHAAETFELKNKN